MKARTSSRGTTPAAIVLLLGAGHPAGAEEVVVELVSAPGAVELSWRGGMAPYEVLRGERRDGADLTTVATVAGPTYAATTDPAAGLEVFRIVASVAPTLSGLQSGVFTPSCAKSGCHVGPSPSAGLDLSAGESFASVVGVASLEQPGLDRITPFDPDASYLVRKVEGQPTISGRRMPGDGPPFLTAAQIAALRAWVVAGAADD